MNSEKPIIVSLGGSIIVPEEVDTDFLKLFKAAILEEVQAGKRFAIFTGGGRTARKYQNAAKELSELNHVDLDWIGIYSTHLNAHFVRYVFKEQAEDIIITNPNEIPETDKPIMVGAGWEPGASTDFDAVLTAEKIGAKTIINLSNIDYVYDKDPKAHDDAKPVEEITWKEFRTLIPEEWSSGAHAPFDPVASKRADELGITVAIINGKDMDSFRNFLNGDSFRGTKIHP